MTLFLGPINSPCAGGVMRQPCALVTVETVTWSIEWTFSFWLRIYGSLSWAETALRSGMAQSQKF